MTTPTGPSSAHERDLAEALAALRSGRAREAIDRLEPLAAAPDPPFEALYALGLAHAQSGQMEPAAIWLEKAVALQPRHAPALFNLAQALLRLNRGDEAKARLEAALAADPGYAKAGQALALLAAAPATGAPPQPGVGPAQTGSAPAATPFAAAPLAPADEGLTPLGPPRARPAAAQPPPGKLLCPECGTANPEGYFACSLCGKPAARRVAVAAAGPGDAFAGAPVPGAGAEERLNPEYDPVREKQDLRVAATLGLVIFGGCAVLTGWRIAAQATEQGPYFLLAEVAGVLLYAFARFIAALGVFTFAGDLGPFRRRSLAALLIAAAWVAYYCIYTLVIDPLFGTFLMVVTLGRGQWLLGFVTVYIATLTCIEKVLDTDLERSHGLAWSVTVATAVLGLAAYFAVRAILAALAVGSIAGAGG